MSNSKFPVPIKDWADAKNYPPVERLRLREIRWGFLRRDREYQEDWSKVQDPHKHWPFVGMPGVGKRWGVDILHDPFGVDTPDFLNDPAVELSWSPSKYANDGRPAELPHTVSEFIQKAMEQGQILVRLAQDLPLEPQLAEVKLQLDAMANQYGIEREKLLGAKWRDARKTVRRSWRLLDAVAASTTHRKIVERFLEDPLPGDSTSLTYAEIPGLLQQAQEAMRRWTRPVEPE